jgi:hypothetical protein
VPRNVVAGAPRVNYPTTEELYEPYWLPLPPHRFQLGVSQPVAQRIASDLVEVGLGVLPGGSRDALGGPRWFY